jgi:D-sedoheptulose 7-phosphate isomerase
MAGTKKSKAEDPQAFIRRYFAGAISAQLAAVELLGPQMQAASEMVAGCIAKGGKWLLCGNGGSAADAQHLAAEMVGRLYKLERRGLPAIALTTDSSILTAVGNDYGYEQVFTRQIEALAQKGDVVLGISTSGKSSSVNAALQAAKKAGCKTIAFSGMDGGAMKKLADIALVVPGPPPNSHIQEAHITMGHCLCFMVEEILLKKGFIKKRR